MLRDPRKFTASRRFSFRLLFASPRSGRRAQSDLFLPVQNGCARKARLPYLKHWMAFSWLAHEMVAARKWAISFRPNKRSIRKACQYPFCFKKGFPPRETEAIFGSSRGKGFLGLTTGLVQQKLCYHLIKMSDIRRKMSER